LRHAFQAPLWFDGAFGTYYFSLTGDETPCELANLKNPALVGQIHREYLKAGATALKTNTFAANPGTLPDPEQLGTVLQAGLEIAQKAAAEHGAEVFADIGGISATDAEQFYLTVAERFLDLGATSFLFETLPSYEELVPALKRIREREPEAKIVVSFAVSQDGYTRRGLSHRALAGIAAADGHADAVGFNCVCGPSHMVSLVKSLGEIGCPIIAMPNAGYPSSLNGRVIFEDNAGYFATRMVELYQAGVDLLGGCCGTTPRHIAQAVRAVCSVTRPERLTAVSEKTVASQVLPHGGKGKKVIAVELAPPQDCDCSFLLSAAGELKSCGADMITVSDSPLSRARADSLMIAAKIRREVGIEVLPHLCCRDKNHIALKAGILGAALEGINRVLVITGDPPVQSNMRNPGVFSFNSFDLISFIASMNTDLFSGRPFLIGGALNVNAANFPVELERARKKIARGAGMLFSQPIFSEQAVKNFLLASRELDCALFAGILPVAGYRNALFLVNEVSGIEIPDAVMQSLKDKTPAQAAEISIAYSAGILEQVYDAADGFYIMTPLKRVDIVRGLIERIHRREEQEESK